ncbi:hypothetical protein J4E85_000016 [Alternaria conjuncta]|uniref:uncharacterized protein n=1 Tax=Alternaria conjuncta TaxID=181017 RepID=UPI00221F189A|nr:uncharacterized protein J4E85_000016 [Alternaria conjuncta]KAI4937581.1 hypothetical protein J4E85_000016 [Alternaria conjuncta]
MQLTTIVAFLAAAASAAPGTLSPRASGSVRARFYNDGGCGSNGNDIAQAELILTSTNVTGKAGCRDLTIGPYPAVFFDQSTLDPNTKIADNLDQTPGNRIDIGPRDAMTGCKSFTVLSYLTLP